MSKDKEVIPAKRLGSVQTFFVDVIDWLDDRYESAISIFTERPKKLTDEEQEQLDTEDFREYQKYLGFEKFKGSEDYKHFLDYLKFKEYKESTESTDSTESTE
jgi:hypothetical protein